MRKLFFFLLLLFSFSVLQAQTSRPPAEKSSSTAKSSASSKTQAKKHGRPVARRARPGQVQPTPQRYKQIQEALAERGYFQGEPDGKWGPASVEALKRFQEDQNIRPTGKLDPLSLIQLGLGPKRQASSVPKPEPQP